MVERPDRHRQGADRGIAGGPLTHNSDDEPVAIEFLVEPFVEGKPGGHVSAAIDAFTSRGLEVEFGAFASTSIGPPDVISEAVGAMIADALAAGATAVNVQVVNNNEKQLSSPSLHHALEAMMRAAEREVGSEPKQWTRDDKQQVVRMLEQRGAFLLRGAVDDVADAMGVSRITIYNYLNAIEGNNE